MCSSVSADLLQITLRALTLQELDVFSKDKVPPGFESRLAKDALPPPFVMARAVDLFDEQELWRTQYLVIDHKHRAIGSCGFKSRVTDGRIDIGYGIAPSEQSRGAATEAVKQLSAIAFGAGVNEVLAEVEPANAASLAVVRKVGFAHIGDATDDEGVLVAQWLLPRDRFLLISKE
jgi:RimJ/RimL family protein N-acetyltransferase